MDDIPRGGLLIQNVPHVPNPNPPPPEKKRETEEQEQNPNRLQYRASSARIPQVWLLRGASHGETSDHSPSRMSHPQFETGMKTRMRSVMAMDRCIFVNAHIGRPMVGSKGAELLPAKVRGGYAHRGGEGREASDQ